MASILYRMLSGIAGDISRRQSSTVEPGILTPALPFAAFGVAAQVAAGKVVPFAAAGETAASLFGFLVRSYPMGGANASDPLGTAVPPTVGVADLLKRGYMTVRNGAGTPALGGVVYVRVAAPAGGKPLGGVEAVADGANSVVIPNTYFTGPADASGNVEIAYNI